MTAMMTPSPLRLLLSASALSLALALAACGEAPQEAGGSAATSSPADSAPAATPEAEAATASIDPQAGERLYKRACFACHDTGAGGAPKRGDAAAWATRLPKGEAALLQSTMKGMGSMPPRGNSPRTASDADIAAAVQHLLAGLAPQE